MGFWTLFLLAFGGLFFGFRALVSWISLLLPSDIFCFGLLATGAGYLSDVFLVLLFLHFCL